MASTPSTASPHTSHAARDSRNQRITRRMSSLSSAIRMRLGMMSTLPAKHSHIACLGILFTSEHVCEEMCPFTATWLGERLDANLTLEKFFLGGQQLPLHTVFQEPA